jgi:quinolinate synthase
MAGMVNGGALQEYKKQNPNIPIVLYINSTAETKQYADVICTSSNAVEICHKIAEEFQTTKIAFSPDENLGKFVQSKLDIDMDFIPDHGYCYVHRLFSASDITKFRTKYPEGKVLVHPECKPEVVELADFVGSTAAMYNYVKNNPDEEFGIGTEIGLLDRIKRELPEIPFKKIHKLRDDAICFSQKKITLESILECIQNIDDPQYHLQLDPTVRENAMRPVQKMFDLMEN